MTAKALQERLRSLGSPEAAALAARYFQTGPGQYGEGDVFLGIRVPVLRRLAREYDHLSLPALRTLLRSEVHEVRFITLLILVRRFLRGSETTQRQVYELYLRNTRYINNWDLVDTSAREIVGRYLADKDRQPLSLLAKSASVWERRISIVATHEWIRRDDFAPTLAIAEQLLDDPHDLIHKATGWMLREVGKRDEAALDEFLRTHGHSMPRTALRYAIERFSLEKRQAYLQRPDRTAPNSSPAVMAESPWEPASQPSGATRSDRRRSASSNRREERG